MRKIDKYVFFWGGPFSQWHLSTFEIDGVKYNCCEQYMVAKKALLFGDYESYKKIMHEKDPAIQKAIGKKIKDFNRDTWKNYCQKFVFDANYAKFTQNYDLLQIILDTGDKEIVEANSNNNIWGIGLDKSNPDILDKNKWRGLNLLGEIIMQVREAIVKKIRL